MVIVGKSEQRIYIAHTINSAISNDRIVCSVPYIYLEAS